MDELHSIGGDRDAAAAAAAFESSDVARTVKCSWARSRGLRGKVAVAADCGTVDAALDKKVARDLKGATWGLGVGAAAVTAADEDDRAKTVASTVVEDDAAVAVAVAAAAAAAADDDDDES